MTTNNINCRFFRIPAQAFDDACSDGVKKLVHGTGHVCVAVRKTGASFRVGFSFKSPADKLDLARGIKIATGRLTSRKPQRNFIVRASTIEEAVDRALTNLFKKTRTVVRRGENIERSMAPDWLIGAVASKKPLVESKIHRVDLPVTV